MSATIGVYRQGTHTCIVVGSNAKYTQYVPMDSEGLACVRAGTSAFLHEWVAYPEYPVARAAEYYLGCLHLQRTDEATAALRALCAKQKNGRPVPPYEVESLGDGMRNRGVVVAEDRKEVTIITHTGPREVGVVKIPLAMLSKQWQNVHSYSGAQIAEVWFRKHFAKELVITPQAHGYLQAANPQAAEIYEEIEIMATAQTEAKPKRQAAPPAAKAVPAKASRKGAAAAAPEKAPKAPAKQAAAPKADAPVVRRASSEYDEKAKIKVLTKENPHKEGSNRAAAFDIVKSAGTVGAYIAAGGAGKYLPRWVEAGNISIG